MNTATMSEASEAPANESVTFDSFGLHPDVLRALTESGYTKHTPIPVSYTHLRAHEALR